MDRMILQIFNRFFFCRKYKIEIHTFIVIKIKVKTSIFINRFLIKLFHFRNYPLRNAVSKIRMFGQVKLSADFVFPRAIPAFAR